MTVDTTPVAQTSQSSASTELQTQTCGCKGIRFCAMCLSSERVRKLRIEEDKYADFAVFVYSNTLKRAVRATQLNSTSGLEDIRKATNEICAGSSESIEMDGLMLVENFLTTEEETDILKMIDKVEWAVSQSGRRKQDFGPKVNFKHRKVKTDNFEGMPEYADFVLEKMRSIDAKRLGNYFPYEMCNLEYEEVKKRGIEMHQDDMWIWGNRLISINLINGTVMTLTNESTRQLCYVLMPHRSLLCMADSIRYDWKHGVMAYHVRGRRIALTMREPALAFQEGGQLYEKYGKELIRLGNQRVKLN
ncbi:hypothetical protein WR25_07684 [Diploscapter pachys]|uniref:Alpha-ketoglutarate-dependent dioxygenase AlkB-like domain-containing protein n=1 Tax=Diploscapter pachys TaxID=2018661 RepID=A0A2A2JPD9_9BILA|nr:hypothetical protein WR25_07684 [Diploscapter pachys]